MRLLNLVSQSVALGVVSLSSAAFAQDGDLESMLALSDAGLVEELDRRYQAGLAMTLDDAVISADDPRYLWALETKVQCGIALGFMESSTRDRTSIGNCDHAFRQMTVVAERPAPAARVIAAPPARRPEACDDDIVGLIFFEFDSAELSADASQSVQSVVSNINECGWNSLTVVGHTDQSGTNQYNQVLSEERAEAVTNALRSRGATLPINTRAEGESNPRVVLPDGTRSPQNRRVEISGR